MIKAETIQAMLSHIKEKAKYMSNDTIEVSLALLAQYNLYYEEAHDALVILSTRPGYKCIEVVHYTNMRKNKESQGEEVIALVTRLPNFDDTWQKFHRYFVFLNWPLTAVEQHPDEDWLLLEDRFDFNNPDIDWTPKKVEDTPSFALNNPEEYDSETDWLNHLNLSTENYNKATGSLELMPGKAVSIPRKGKVKKSTGAKYFECKVMEKLFDSKTTLSNGVSFHSLLGIHQNVTLKRSDVKKVTNVRTAINKKLSEETGLKKLIIVRRNKAYINHLYLLKD